MPVGVDLARPEWLLALPALAALLVIARLPWWRAALIRRAASPQSFRAEVRRLAVRLAWLSLPLLALAGLALSRPLDRLAVIFVVDASASVASVRDQQDATAGDALRELRGGDIAGVVTAGAGARVAQPPAEDPLLDVFAGEEAAPASDLATALALAGGLVPPDRTGRVVLLSDGRETSGDAAGTARELSARGIEVDVVPVGPDAVADVRLDRLDLPEIAREGESPVMRVSVTAGRATPARLRVYRDDTVVAEESVDLRAGSQEFALALPPAGPGTHRVRVEVAAGNASADATPLNNVLGAVQRVLGPPTVLVVASDPGQAGFLPAALEASGAIVRVAAPSALPADLAGYAAYDAVVLADVPASALPDGAEALLERYVRELGRGLVMTGGPDAFGAGGYEGTPVEDALPVYMDLQGRGREPRVALMLVIDKSGSMTGLKMEMAKEAAVRSARLLNARDQVGVIAFDSFPQWVAPLAQVEDGDWVEQRVGTVFASGGTEIFPAVSAAFDALVQTEADVKHLIVLTDGHSGSGGDYPELLGRLREERVTLSSVAVGNDADTALLEAMAAAGRGRSHTATDPAELPAIFSEETLMATRTILVEEAFFPAAASASPLLRGVDSVPALDGYVAVTPKETAEVVLVAPEGDPVLAAWQYGAGRAIAWTPDLGGRWAAGWAGSATAPLLWGNALSWLLPPPDEGELVVHVEPLAGGHSLVVENRTAWDEVRPTRATLVGPEESRIEVELSPAGPGRYRAALPDLPPDAYVIQAEQTLPSGEALRAEAGWASPYPAEYREVGVDTAALARIAEAGGGRVLDDPLQAVRAPEQPAVSRWPLAPLLLVLAALAWPLEIASRRLPRPSLPAWLRRRLARPEPAPQPLEVPVRGSSAPAAPSVSAGPPPATADRLLERTRALRERRRR